MGGENARMVGVFAERWITAGEIVSGVHSPLVGLQCAGVVVPLAWFTLCRGGDRLVSNSGGTSDGGRTWWRRVHTSAS
jgi:hypothetical protein